MFAFKITSLIPTIIIFVSNVQILILIQDLMETKPAFVKNNILRIMPDFASYVKRSILTLKVMEKEPVYVPIIL